MASPTGRSCSNLSRPRGKQWSKAVDAKLGERYLYCAGDVSLLFTENETNTQRIFGVANRTPYVKDGINNYVVLGQAVGGQSRTDGDQGRGALSPDGQPGRMPR